MIVDAPLGMCAMNINKIGFHSHFFKDA